MPPELAHDFPARTGLPVTHVASLFKIAWLRDQGLSLAGLQWLSLPEFVIAHLGGRRVAELSLMGRTGFLDIHTNAPYLPALAHLGVDEGLLPELVGAGTPAGRVRSDHPVVAARGAVLTVAGHDHAVAAAAAGSAATASAMDSFGTAEAFLVASGHVPDPDVVRELTTHGVSVYPHVVHGTTGLLAGMRTGLVLKRVLRLLGADDEDGRSRVDRESLAHRGDRSGDIGVSGFSMSDHDVTVHLRGDSPTPGKVWRAALDHSTAHAADPPLAPRHRRGSHRATRARGWLEPDAVGPRRAPCPRPHGRGRRHPAAGPSWCGALRAMGRHPGRPHQQRPAAPSRVLHAGHGDGLRRPCTTPG